MRNGFRDLMACCLVVAQTLLGYSTLASQRYPIILGHGYDSIRLSPQASLCIDGQFQEDTAAKVKLAFYKASNWSSLLGFINFSIPGSIYLAESEELAKFAFKARDTIVTSTYVLHSRIVLRKEFIVDPIPRFSELDRKEFYARCGNRFIASKEQGGELLIGVKLYFSHHHQKQSFEGGGTVNSLAGLISRIKSMGKSLQQNSSIEVFFNQIGGSPSLIQKIFSSRDVVACELNDYQNCLDLITDLWDYGKDRFPDSVIASQPETISHSTMTYPGRQEIYEKPTVTMKRHELIESLDKSLDDLDIINSISWRKAGAQNCDQVCLKSLVTKLSANVQSLKELIALSFTDGKYFLERTKPERFSLRSYDMPKTDGLFDQPNHHRYLFWTSTVTASAALAIGAGFGIFKLVKLWRTQGKTSELKTL